MAVSNPSGVNGGAGLDTGQYYVWDWTKVTAGQTTVPQVVGVCIITGSAGAPTGGWVGNSLTLTMQAQFASQGSADLLVLTPISGAIRKVTNLNSVVENCELTGLIGVTFDYAMVTDVGVLSGASPLQNIRSCEVTVNGGSAAIGGMGVIVSQGGMVLNVDVNAAWIGVRFVGVNCALWGGRQEICCYGIVVGGLGHPAGGGANNNANACAIMATESEGTWGAALIGDTSNLGDSFVSGLVVLLNHQNSCYGIYTNGANNVQISNCSISGGGNGGNQYGGCWNGSLQGPGTPAGIYIGDAGGPSAPTYCSFVSCFVECGQGTDQNGAVSTAWRLPTSKPWIARFYNCNNPAYAVTFAVLPTPIAATGSITGKLLTVTGGSFANKAVIGSQVTTATGGGAVATNTIITSQGLTGTNQTCAVNNSQTVASGPITIWPACDGDEYEISDSPIPYTPTFTTSGSGSGSATMTLTVNVPGYVTANMSVIDVTSRTVLGTIRAATISGATFQFNGTATWASGDTIVFAPLSNVGTPVTTGGGTNHVKVRWNSSQQAWVIV
jgi:hypothetical protein